MLFIALGILLLFYLVFVCRVYFCLIMRYSFTSSDYYLQESYVSNAYVGVRCTSANLVFLRFFSSEYIYICVCVCIYVYIYISVNISVIFIVSN